MEEARLTTAMLRVLKRLKTVGSEFVTLSSRESAVAAAAGVVAAEGVVAAWTALHVPWPRAVAPSL